MEVSYKTSLYVSLKGKSVPSQIDVRRQIWNLIKGVSGVVVLDEEKELFTYGSGKICFSVVYSEGQYLSAFRPCGNVQAFGKESLAQSENVLAFCNSIGNELKVATSPPLTFQRQIIQRNNRIDISFWEIDCPYSGTKKKTTVFEFRGSAINNSVAAVPTNNEMRIFTDTYVKGTGPFIELRNKLSTFGTVSGPEPIANSRWAISNISPRNKQSLIFVFLEDQAVLEKHYVNDKIFFDSNHMPTQYVRANTVAGKFPTLSGVKANFILEMLTKMGKQPVKLIAPEEIFVNDGFLCLSDVETVKNKLFGAIFTYTKQGLDTLKEEVHIYDNIAFKTPTEHTIELYDESFPLLANNIYGLVGSNTIDILLTKRWKLDAIKKLVDLLQTRNISTKRVYYISSRASRFVDEYLLGGTNDKSLQHPYLIVNDKIAFLKASTQIRIFNNLFSLFVELQYPENGKINYGDLEKLLWLAKKRIYRIQEFSVLKNPEPIYVFRNLKKMYVGEIGTKNMIPMRLLI
jgi:hypothetical protein